jgi:hypothetical protein
MLRGPAMRADEPCVHERELTFPLGRFFFLTGLPCAECAAEEHAAWVESVRVRLVAAVEAIGRGEPVVWDTWPRAEEPEEPEDAWEPPQYEGLDLEPRPYASGDVWQNVLDFYADLERDRAEHGPRLRELRCDPTVLTYLTLRWRPNGRKPWEPQPWGTPIIEDADIPARIVRCVYDDGTSEDIVAVGAAVYEMIRDMPKTLEFKQPTAPNRFSDNYRYGLLAETRTYSPIWGLNA